MVSRGLKTVQDEYQRFASMKIRSSSNANVGEMTNPGTEVTINCVNAFIFNDNLGLRS
jgi:hypothetical protein